MRSLPFSTCRHTLFAMAHSFVISFLKTTHAQKIFPTNATQQDPLSIVNHGRLLVLQNASFLILPTLNARCVFFRNRFIRFTNYRKLENCRNFGAITNLSAPPIAFFICMVVSSTLHFHHDFE